MAQQIQGSSSTGTNFVGVTNDKQLKTLAQAQSYQGTISRDKGEAYQVYARVTDVSASSTYNLLYIENTSEVKDLIVTYMRMSQVLAGTLPTATARFQIGFGEDYTSDGTAVTPVNMNTGSAQVAPVLCYTSNPTLAGSLEVFDSRPVKSSADEYTYNKDGSIVLGQGKSLTIQLVTDTGNTGAAYARVSFVMVPRP